MHSQFCYKRAATFGQVDAPALCLLYFIPRQVASASSLPCTCLCAHKDSLSTAVIFSPPILPSGLLLAFLLCFRFNHMQVFLSSVRAKSID